MYRVLLFVHLLGFVLLGGALVTATIQHLRASKSKDPAFLHETYRTLAIALSWVAPPGALLLALSGIGLVWVLGVGFLSRGWLIGMWGLFLPEFLEGLFHAAPHARRLVRLAEEARQQGALTPALLDAMRNPWARALAAIDLPVFLIITALAVFKPF